MALPLADETYDAVTISFGLRNMADRVKCLSEMRRVLRAGGEAQALRILDRTAAVVWVIVIASLVIGYVWFALMPIPEPGSSFVAFFPFPFASGQISFTP